MLTRIGMANLVSLMSYERNSYHNMSKLIFYLVIAILIYWLLNNRKSKHMKKETLVEPIEDMVCCRHCGIHLPKSEAILIHKDYYCCKEHCNQHANN